MTEQGFPGLAHYLSAVAFHRPLDLENIGYHFRFQSVPSPRQLPADRLYLNHDVLVPILHLRQIPKRDYRVVPGESLVKLSTMPTLLGWRQDGMELDAQLAQLKTRCGEGPVRFLLLGADGGLGDIIIKLPAWRALINVLSAHFDDFQLDLASVPVGAQDKHHLLHAIRFPGRIRTDLLTVADLTEYDGLFVPMGHSRLTRWGTEPIVDTTLRLLGLAPDILSARHKRPLLAIDRAAWAEMAQRIRALPAGPKVVFNPAASGNLRSFPPVQAAAFARALVAQHPSMQLIVPMPLKVSHPRIHHWGPLPTYHHFSALIGQVDGQVSVDTFGVHVADVFELPTVTLSSTVDMERFFPYYPANMGITVPGAKRLPGWGRAQMDDPQQWESVRQDYESAWERLSAEAVWQRLWSAMRQHAPRRLPVERLRLIDRPVRPVAPWREHEGALRLWGERPSKRWLEMEAQGRDTLPLVLRRGMRVLWLTPGSFAPLEQVVDQLGGMGHLTVLEPRESMRRLVHHRLGPLGLPYELFTRYPWPEASGVRRPGLNPWRRFESGSWGNLPGRQTVLDAAPWTEDGVLDAVVLQPPSGLIRSLEGLASVFRQQAPDLVLLGYGPAQLYRLQNRLEGLYDEPAQMWLRHQHTELVLVRPVSRGRPPGSGWQKLNIEA